MIDGSSPVPPMPRPRGAHAVPMEAAAVVFAGVFVLVTVDVLRDTRGVLDQWLIDAIQRIDSGGLHALFRPVDTLTGHDGAVAKWLTLVAVFAILLLWLPAMTVATSDATATVRFGRPDTGSPFPPPDGHDASSNAKDNIEPRTVVIALNGRVTFEISGFHQPAIYEAGTEPGDITAPPFPPNLFVNDANDRLALGPLNAPPATTTWTSPAGTFDQPGRYLVICNITPHFALFNMYGWVIVQ